MRICAGLETPNKSEAALLDLLTPDNRAWLWRERGILSTAADKVSERAKRLTTYVQRHWRKGGTKDALLAKFQAMYLPDEADEQAHPDASDRLTLSLREGRVCATAVGATKGRRLCLQLAESCLGHARRNVETVHAGGASGPALAVAMDAALEVWALDALRAPRSDHVLYQDAENPEESRQPSGNEQMCAFLKLALAAPKPARVIQPQVAPTPVAVRRSVRVRKARVV